MTLDAIREWEKSLAFDYCRSKFSSIIATLEIWFEDTAILDGV